MWLPVTCNNSVIIIRMLCCRCDAGYGGITCSPETQLPNSLKTDFSMMHKLESDWSAVLGADVAGANQGCGVLLSGESLYFSKVLF